MEKKEKRVMVVNDGSSIVKCAIAALDATQTKEPEVLPIVLEIRERGEALNSIRGLMFAGMSQMLGCYGGSPLRDFYPEPPKPIKRCLQCGNEHRHNNSFCSAQCCKGYANKQKLLRRRK